MAELVTAMGGGASDLFGRVSSLIEQTRSYVASQANAALTMLNWQIGHLIDAEVLGEQRAGYAEEAVASLGQQLTGRYWTALPPKEELQQRIAQISRAAQERVAGRALGPGRDNEEYQ